MVKVSKWRQLAKQELSKIRDFDVQAERTIQSYIDMLEAKLPITDIEAAQARIAELEANHASALEVSRIKGEELAAAIAENEAYRAALKPFADTANRYQRLKSATIIVTITELALTLPTGDYLTLEAFRRAAEVYAKFEGAGDAKSRTPLE